MDQILVSKILKHPLLSDYNTFTTKTILENLMEVCELNNVLQKYLSVGSEDKIVYLLKQLMLQKNKMTKRNVFWKQFGNIINDTDQFL
eukprot:210164_1